MPTSDNEHPTASVRRQRMLEAIRDRGFVRVRDLSAEFSVSEVTVRTDLDALAAAARIRRVHGGAVLDARDIAPEASFEESLEASAGQKRAIGRAAADLVVSGASVILDVGTTTAAMARALVERTDLTDVVVVTSGLNIALILEEAMPRLTVMVTGGTLRRRQHSLVDPLASRSLAGLHADVAFIGCTGVDPDRGVTNVNVPETEVKRAMVDAAERSVVVAHSSKLGRVHLGKVADLSRFDTLVTGSTADAELLRRLRESAVTVLTV